MLITRVKPSHLWGKSAYDDDGRLLGKVVAVASRRGVVRRVVVQCTVPVAEPTAQPRLWVVR